MSATGRLGAQVVFVVFVRRKGMRDPFLNGDAAIGKGRNLVRVVGHQPHPVETELVQDLSGGQINLLIGIEA